MSLRVATNRRKKHVKLPGKRETTLSLHLNNNKITLAYIMNFATKKKRQKKEDIFYYYLCHVCRIILYTTKEIQMSLWY